MRYFLFVIVLVGSFDLIGQDNRVTLYFELNGKRISVKNYCLTISSKDSLSTTVYIPKIVNENSFLLPEDWHIENSTIIVKSKKFTVAIYGFTILKSQSMHWTFGFSNSKQSKNSDVRAIAYLKIDPLEYGSSSQITSEITNTRGYFRSINNFFCTQSGAEVQKNEN